MMKFIKNKNGKINGDKVVSLIFFTIIIYMGFVIITGDYYNGIPYANYIKILFWSKDGFNASLLTALVAIIGVIITIITHRSGINANIVSKERARWMNHHKEIVAEYITNFINYSMLIELSIMYAEKALKEDISKEEKEINIEKKDDIIEQINDLVFKNEKNKNLLNLELHGHSSENEKFLNIIQESYDTAVKARVMLKKGEKKKSKAELAILSNHLKELTKISSEFYYNVWQQIKNND